MNSNLFFSTALVCLVRFITSLTSDIWCDVSVMLNTQVLCDLRFTSVVIQITNYCFSYLVEQHHCEQQEPDLKMRINKTPSKMNETDSANPSLCLTVFRHQYMLGI